MPATAKQPVRQLYRKTHIFFGGGRGWGTHQTIPKPNRWTRKDVAQLVSTYQPNPKLVSADLRT
jgi:hypothetical protein